MIQELLIPAPIFALCALLLIVFLFKDRTRKHSILILISLVLWNISILAEHWVLDFSFLSSIFLIISALLYLLRFRAYEHRRPIDWIKIPLVIVFVALEIFELRVYLISVGSALFILYTIDKIQYSDIVSKNWKNAIVISFGVSIVSIFTLAFLKGEEEERLTAQSMEQIDEINKLRSELISCDVNRKSVNRNLMN